MDYGLKHIIGNLLTQSIDEIYSGDKFKAFMDTKDNGSICHKCKDFGYVKEPIGFVTYQKTFNGGEAASTRIRVTWPSKYLDAYIDPDIDVLLKCKAVVFQTRFSWADCKLAQKLKDNGIKIIFDLTDPDWLQDYSGISDNLKHMIDMADCVTLPTQILNNLFKKTFENIQTVVIPDRLDLTLYNKVVKHIDKTAYKILWHGSYGNIGSINLARNDLERLGQEFDITLVCIYDRINDFKVNEFKNIKLECHEWTNQKVADEMLLCDLSINPKYDRHWKSYKSNNKTILAWACGVPCVERNFYEEVRAYLSNTKLRVKDAKKLRAEVESNYDVKTTAKEIKELVHNLVEDIPLEPKKVTVYTAVCGGHDGLREDQIISPNADYVAYVDRDTTSYVWQTKRIYHKFVDPVYEAKIFKVLPWQYLDTEYSIWIDGSVAIKCEPLELIDKFLKDADIALFKHAQRDDIYDEYEVDLGYRQKEPAKFRLAQREKYQREGVPKKSGLWECGIILRRHTEEVKRFCETWWSEITAFTHSDQCSFMYSALKHGIKINAMYPGNMYQSPYFHRVPHEKTWDYSISSQPAPQFIEGMVTIKRIAEDTFHCPSTGRLNYNDIKQIDGAVATQLLSDYPNDFVIIN
jgi:hypothetical protein